MRFSSLHGSAQSWSTRSSVGALDRESVLSIAQTGTPCFFSIFYSTLMLKTYNKKKILKQKKKNIYIYIYILENNKAKGLTNIN
jgi:hypothetical protein